MEDAMSSSHSTQCNGRLNGNHPMVSNAGPPSGQHTLELLAQIEFCWKQNSDLTLLIGTWRILPAGVISLRKRLSELHGTKVVPSVFQKKKYQLLSSLAFVTDHGATLQKAINFLSPLKQKCVYSRYQFFRNFSAIFSQFPQYFQRPPISISSHFVQQKVEYKHSSMLSCSFDWCISIFRNAIAYLQNWVCSARNKFDCLCHDNLFIRKS
eukprot:EG_transcript_23272